jgi:hypothetical protein
MELRGGVKAPADWGISCKYSGIIFRRFGLPTPEAVLYICGLVTETVQTYLQMQRACSFYFRDGARVDELLYGLGAILCFLGDKGSMCDPINSLLSRLCSSAPIPGSDPSVDSYQFTGCCNVDLWKKQQQPGQIHGEAQNQAWIFGNDDDGREFWISQIGDVQYENIHELYVAFARNPMRIVLAKDVRTDLAKIATCFKWIYDYARADGSPRNSNGAIVAVAYMHLAAWFEYLATFRGGLITARTDSKGSEWSVFEHMRRPLDLPRRGPTLLAVPWNPNPNPGPTQQEVWNEVSRHFPNAEDPRHPQPITNLFKRDYPAR